MRQKPDEPLANVEALKLLNLLTGRDFEIILFSLEYNLSKLPELEAEACKLAWDAEVESIDEDQAFQAKSDVIESVNLLYSVYRDRMKQLIPKVKRLVKILGVEDEVIED